MNYIFVIICSILLPVFSLKKVTPKLCINCKYFEKDPENGLEHSKCSLFPIEENNVNFLVTGYKNINHQYYCLTARQYEILCGKEGFNYEENPTKKEKDNLK